MPPKSALIILALTSAFAGSLVSARAQSEAAGSPRQPPVAERFGRLDANRDGSIAWTEAAPQRRAEFAAMDKNGDSRISPEEFRGRTAPFATVDADRNGALSEDEYLRYHQSMFQHFDTNGDKQINLPEFTAAQEAAGQK